MNLYILATFIAVTTAAQLPSSSYIPQGQGSQPSGLGGSSSFQGSSGFHSGSSGFSGGSNGFGGSGGFSGGNSGHGGGSGNTRPQQQQEKNAAILKQEQDISESGDYHFGYETENGIRAEESGNPSQAQGGFSYKGDDGHTYTITYTSGEGGFRPQGEHIPVPPPIPQEILEALKQNERDEAAGIFDDGKYKPDVHGGPSNTGSGGSHGGSGGFGNHGNQGFGGNQQFGGNHQSGFNPSTGYTY